MKRALMALAAAGILAVTAVAAPAPAEARGGRIAAGVIGGLAAGAILGGALSGGYGYGYGPGYYGYGGPYGYYGGGPAYVADPVMAAAATCSGSASGTVTAGVSAAFRSATDKSATGFIIVRIDGLTRRWARHPRKSR